MDDETPAEETGLGSLGADPRPNGSPDDEGEAFAIGQPSSWDHADSTQQTTKDPNS